MKISFAAILVFCTTMHCLSQPSDDLSLKVTDSLVSVTSAEMLDKERLHLSLVANRYGDIFHEGADNLLFRMAYSATSDPTSASMPSKARFAEQSRIWQARPAWLQVIDLKNGLTLAEFHVPIDFHILAYANGILWVQSSSAGTNTTAVVMKYELKVR